MGEFEDESWSKRRLAILGVVGIVVLLGAGIGTVTVLNSGPTPDEPELTITSPGSPTTTPVDGSDTTTVQRKANVSLGVTSGATLLETDDVVPGDRGTGTLRLRNDGESPGRLRVVSVSITDAENGIVGAEARVDDSPADGELADVIRVRMTSLYPDGETAIVVGSESSYAPLSALDAAAFPNATIGPGETVTVALDWRVNETVGNQIQSDRVTFDIVFELRAPED